MMAINVRQANQVDLTHIVAHYGQSDSPWDPFADLAKLQNIPLDGLIVAEVEGSYAGFLYWFLGEKPWFDSNIERYAYITEVQVLERYQRQGVGRMLMSYALKCLKENNIQAVYIDTTEDNLAAQHL